MRSTFSSKTQQINRKNVLLDSAELDADVDVVDVGVKLRKLRNKSDFNALKRLEKKNFKVNLIIDQWQLT